MQISKSNDTGADYFLIILYKLSFEYVVRDSYKSKVNAGEDYAETASVPP